MVSDPELRGVGDLPLEGEIEPLGSLVVDIQ